MGLAQIGKGQHPKARQEADAEQAETDRKAAAATVSLKQAWQRYLEAHLIRKGRSKKTISGYRAHVERLFAEWLREGERRVDTHILNTRGASVAKT